VVLARLSGTTGKWIPLSLWGIHHGANIVAIHPDTHKHIHEVMNYSRNVYSRMYRAYRKKHNHKTEVDCEMIEDRLRIMEGYLSRYNKLCPKAYNLHFQKMNELTKHYNPNHKYQHKWSKLWYEFSEAYKNYFLNPPIQSIH